MRGFNRPKLILILAAAGAMTMLARTLRTGGLQIPSFSSSLEPTHDSPHGMNGGVQSMGDAGTAKRRYEAEEAEAMVNDAKKFLEWEQRCPPSMPGAKAARQAPVSDSPNMMLAAVRQARDAKGQAIGKTPQEIAKELLNNRQLSPGRLKIAMEKYRPLDVYQAVLSLTPSGKTAGNVLSRAAASVRRMNQAVPTLPNAFQAPTEEQAEMLNIALLAFLRMYGPYANKAEKCVPAILTVTGLPADADAGITYKGMNLSPDSEDPLGKPIIPACVNAELEGEHLAAIAFHELLHAYSSSMLFAEIAEHERKVGEKSGESRYDAALFIVESITEGLATRWTRNTADTGYEIHGKSHLLFERLLSHIDTSGTGQPGASQQEKAEVIVAKAYLNGDSDSVRRVVDALSRIEEGKAPRDEL